ncbi:phosphatase domain-containing protein [Niabella yanshanensis]|uniref:Phosphatase domain-containing protein n=2 Tax=Niabella yanshanensis TaxID=577386 RepID=A0ABZ0W586_9BACT|nr:phosphatase domain-containing protein [Niabella yanshanensis]WQD37180.1 phosphatase domain-containing protein [Niabella yanshanensis]
MLKKSLNKKLHLIKKPHLKVYEGFGNGTHCTLMGHALTQSASPREIYRNGFFHNTLALLKTFMIKTMPDAWIQVNWQGKVSETHTEADGFFVIDLPNDKPLEPGDYTVDVALISKNDRKLLDTATSHIVIPEVNQFAFISDIDDTFLISHSESILKRLKLLLTRNAYSRKPFDGVVKHYQALQLAQTTADKPNPFFYVSSSEWNLYDFIKKFIEKNELPDGICLLNQIQNLSKILKSGQKNHASKFARIVRILEAYPTQRFILLGDDSQHDPYIYSSLVKNFPELISGVYIRCVGKQRKQVVTAELDQISGRDIPVCYFLHSSEALKHSESIGLTYMKKGA